VTVQPALSRVTVTERRTPSTTVELVEELDPPPSEDELDETEELDDPEPVLRDETETPSPSSATVLSTTRPSAR
jgi:hypothetical protein